MPVGPTGYGDSPYQSFSTFAGNPYFISIEELLKYIEEIDSEVMIIGGASIYKQMIDYADKMILTEIDDEANASVYYPKFDVNDWDKEIISKHNYNDIEYSHVIYTRKSGN